MSNKTLAVSILIIILLFAGAVVFFRKTQPGVVKNTQQSTEQRSEQTQEVSKQEPTMTNENKCVRNYDENKYKTSTISTENRQVEITVEGYGKIVVEPNAQAAPKTSENFLKLVDAGFYDCLTFHRVARNFVVQGGDPAGNGSGGPGFTIPAEIGLLHKKGSIAMARLGDEANPTKASSGSQFYIALNDLPMLDGAYTVFGQVVSGMDVVEKIGMAEITPNPFMGGEDGSPKQPVVMSSVKIIK